MKNLYVYLCDIRYDRNLLNKYEFNKGEFKCKYFRKIYKENSKDLIYKNITNNMIAVSIGDINGIGIKIIIQLWKKRKINNFILVTNYKLFQKYLVRKNIDINLNLLICIKNLIIIKIL